MPDTGAPWNIPFLDGTELVRAYPDCSEDLADAVADGLSAAGGLVAVKHAIFTGTQTNSTAGGANFAVDDLSITHEVADASNKLIISAFFGAAANNERGRVGIAIHDGSGLISIGAADGDRTQVTAGGTTTFAQAVSQVTMPHITIVHTPGAGAKTYTVRAINVVESTSTVFINRNEVDGDNAGQPRAVSSLVIQEVRA